MKQRGFTLIEILMVIAIIAVLGAILFPVFASVREKGRQICCVSNLHQLGLAVELYAQDSDDVLPLGGDPIDTQTELWKTAGSGKYWALAQTLPPLPKVLGPYAAGSGVWRCPSDTGFDVPDLDGDVPLAAHPSAYEAYGCSYSYHTGLAFRQETLAGMASWDLQAPHAEHGASEINLLWDLSGNWHGEQDASGKRFNVLMGDGHVRAMSYDALNEMFQRKLDPTTL